MKTIADPVCIATRKRRPRGAGLALTSVFILLASAAVGSGSAAAAATDRDKLEAKVAKSAILEGTEQPKLPCVCQDGTRDTKGGSWIPHSTSR